jgi:hypothetical protein
MYTYARVQVVRRQQELDQLGGGCTRLHRAPLLVLLPCSDSRGACPSEQGGAARCSGGGGDGGDWSSGGTTGSPAAARAAQQPVGSYVLRVAGGAHGAPAAQLVADQVSWGDAALPEVRSFTCFAPPCAAGIVSLVGGTEGIHLWLLASAGHGVHANGTSSLSLNFAAGHCRAAYGRF